MRGRADPDAADAPPGHARASSCTRPARQEIVGQHVTCRQKGVKVIGHAATSVVDALQRVHHFHGGLEVALLRAEARMVQGVDVQPVGAEDLERLLALPAHVDRGANSCGAVPAKHPTLDDRTIFPRGT
jgi:hypothetical protein